MRCFNAKDLHAVSLPSIEPESVTFTQGCIHDRSRKGPVAGRNRSVGKSHRPGAELDLIIVRPDRHRYCALSGLCTHFPRPLTYIPARRVLQCNNFNHSIFDLEGNVREGPGTQGRSGPFR